MCRQAGGASVGIGAGLAAGREALDAMRGVWGQWDCAVSFGADGAVSWVGEAGGAVGVLQEWPECVSRSV